MNHFEPYECGTNDHYSRRTLLKAAGVSGLSWLTPMADVLATSAEKVPETAKSVIILWLNGGPSQVDTFDPHPGKKIAADTVLSFDTRCTVRGRVGHASCSSPSIRTSRHPIGPFRARTAESADPTSWGSRAFATSALDSIQIPVASSKKA